MTRKTPIRHTVKPYKRDDGTTVRQHVKGNGAEKVTYREGSIIPEYLEERMKENERESQISELERIKTKGKISPHLRSALTEAINALKNGNVSLATEITSVKSFISGNVVASKKDHFTEDTKYNEKVLGRSVYGLLDSLHHNLAFASGEIPSGVMIYSASGKREREPTKFKSPTLRMIKRERDAIWGKVKKETPGSVLHKWANKEEKK